MSEKIDQLIQDGIDFFNQQNWAQAQEVFEEVLSIEPENQEANAFLGSILFTLGDSEDARRKFELVKSDDAPRKYSFGEWGVVLNNWGRLLAENENFDDAVQKLSNAIKYDPSNQPQYYYDLGLAFERQEDNPNHYQEAAQQYEATVKADETYTDAWNDWGRMLLALKRYEEAIAKFKKATEVDPKYKYAYYNWGLALERQEDNPNHYQEAAQQYEATVKADETYTDAWNDWGRMLLALKRYEEAIAKFKEATEVDPKYKYAYYNWGLALERQEDNPNHYQEAAQQYEAAVKADETYTDAWNDWGRMLLELKMYDEAVAKFKKATGIDPKYQYAYRNWGLALERQEENPNRYEEAAQQYEAALKADETYTDAWTDWGRTLLELKRYDEAIAKFKKATEIDPKYKYAYSNWGLALERQEDNPNRYEDATQQYEAAVKADETYTDAWNDWGRTLLELKRYDEAVAKFKKATEVDPKYKYAYYNWGLALERQKRYKEAIYQYKKSIQADPAYIDAHNGLGFALLDKGEYSMAAQQFRKVIDLDLNAPTGYHNLAYLLESQGKYKQALEMWDKAFKTYRSIRADKRTQFDWDFLGQISLYYFQNYETSKNYLITGLEAFPESLELLGTYVALNLELREKYAYETPNALEMIASAHWEAFDGYQKIIRAFEEKTEKDMTPELYLKLARISVLMEDHAKAEDNLKEALKLDDSLAEAYNLLGLIKTKREDYKESIQDFISALKYAPDDFGIISNLAEAYLKDERFEDAEKTFQKILAISPSHMDSLIGLGETYAAMGDAAKEGSRAGDAEMMYTRAIEYYSKAIDYEERAKNKKQGEFTEASKRLKPRELNGVYYSRGYARVSLRDAQSGKSDLLLLQAQNDFRKVTKYPADESYHKAKRSMAKVLERLNPASSQNIEQRTGPVLISFLAFILFLMSLFAFFKGRPEFSSPGFRLTEESLQVLEASHLPPDALANLDNLVGKEFLTQDGLLAAIKLTVGQEVFTAYEKVLLAQPLGEPSQLVWKPIEIGYLVLIAFGALIFMVAGLYLQQISKLKFGSIEIEKSSVSQISSSGALSIRK